MNFNIIKTERAGQKLRMRRMAPGGYTVLWVWNRTTGALVGKIGSTGSSYFDCNDMTSFLESHFKDLPTGSAANLPLIDQIGHLGRIPLENDNTHGYQWIGLNFYIRFCLDLVKDMSFSFG